MHNDTVRQLAAMSAKDRGDLKRRVLAIFRRAELRQVDGIKGMPKKQSLHNFRAKCAKSLRQDISYQTLPSVENIGRKTQRAKQVDIIGRNYDGTIVAETGKIVARNNSDSTPACLVSNGADLSVPDDGELPNEYEFEILRLKRRILELEAIIRDKDERLVRSLSMLEDDLQMFRTYLNDHVGETLGTLMKRVIRIESTIAYVKDIAAHVLPELPMPERWKTAIADKSMT